MRSPTYRAFSRIVGARVEEAELPLAEYPSLSHFFARRLRTGARMLDSNAVSLTSPCDGVVAALGAVEDGHLIQAKGKDYSVADLVVDQECARSLQGGTYITIYLSPKDYHRVHAPMDCTLLGYDYVPGTQFPVNPLFSRSIDELMARNERVIFHMEIPMGEMPMGRDTPMGRVCMVMVAALGVSNIEVAHDRLETRYLRPDRNHRTIRFEQPLDISRGDEVGTFHLGSTTILLFPPNTVHLDEVALGDRVHFGQALGRLAEKESRHSSPETSDSTPDPKSA